jgi:nucleoside-diphosphate-sugar epimerase
LKIVSVIIDASADTKDLAGATANLLHTIESAVKDYPDKRFTFIYTSGVWVYGDRRSPYGTVDETDPLNPIPLIDWRPDIEQRVIRNRSYDGVVIRPGLVSGRSGSIFTFWFEAVEKGQVTLINDDQTRAAPVHTDDLAEAYVNAVERIELTKGQVFNVANPQTENVTDIIKAMARAAKVDVKISYKPASNPFEVAQGLYSPVFDIRKAKKLLGFEQRRPGVVDGMERYYKAWKAHQ